MKRLLQLEECDIIRDGYSRWLKTWQIVEELNALPCNETHKRNNHQVDTAIKELGLRRQPSPNQVAARRRNMEKASMARTQEISLDVEFRIGDWKFKEAMLAAARAGGEKVTLGVVKDRRPSHAKFVHADPIFSMCGSAAAECAASGSSDTENMSQIRIMAH